MDGDLLHFERRLWRLGYRWIAGCDEAGRGPLAGPVVAAAVVFPFETPIIPGIMDSKKLSMSRRRELVPIIRERALSWAVARVDEGEIDQLNILRASLKAMALALSRLELGPDAVLVDGNFAPPVALPCTPLVHGDARSLSIAAASILAKETRDELMRGYDCLFPQYGFAKHKGYPTREHLYAIKKNGVSVIHRRTFSFRLPG